MSYNDFGCILGPMVIILIAVVIEAIRKKNPTDEKNAKISSNLKNYENDFDMD